MILVCLLQPKDVISENNKISK